MSTKKPTTTAVATTIAFADLPALKTKMHGGTYAGCITHTDGVQYAVIALPRPGKNKTWEQAKGTAPTKAVAALITTNLPGFLKPGLYWTCEEYNAAAAWGFDADGGTSYGPKGAEGGALAVRLIPLTDR